MISMSLLLGASAPSADPLGERSGTRCEAEAGEVLVVAGRSWKSRALACAEARPYRWLFLILTNTTLY